MGSQMSLWLLIIATLGGTLLGGVIGLINTRMQSGIMIKREREKLILGKLEELHEVLSQFRSGYGDLSLLASSDAAVEALIKGHAAIPREKLRMLVGFYAPQLWTKIQHVEELSGEYDKALARLLEWKREGAKAEDIPPEVSDLKQKLDRASAEMQAEVIALSRKYI